MLYFHSAVYRYQSDRDCNSYTDFTEQFVSIYLIQVLIYTFISNEPEIESTIKKIWLLAYDLS